ncbi:MAG: EamA family transporter [Bacteroidota bacterium]
MNKNLQLHLIILIWGFTPVIGKYISLQAVDLVWCRLIVAAISLYAYIRYKNISLQMNRRQLGIIFGMGGIVGIHWYFFYHAIKVSNVSIALSGFATMTLFASLLQPVLLGKKFFWGDLLYGIFILIGLSVILDAEHFYITGIVYGVLAALTGAIFGVYNGKLINRHEASSITLFEFMGAFVLLTGMKCFSDDPFIPTVSMSDAGGLLLLGIVCTTLAFTWSIHILKYFSPFTVIITNNLEPVYGIILSILLFGQTEVMSKGFYFGTAIILLSVFTYPVIKRKFYPDDTKLPPFIEQP